MSIAFYYVSPGCPRSDSLFGDPQNNHGRSASVNDPFPGSVLLEAERRYGLVLAQNGVEKLSIFTYFRSSGWHRSPSNPQAHYTLRGYNAAGWMVVTLEMEAGNGGKVYAYGRRERSRWLRKVSGNQARLQARHFFHRRDHVEAAISWEGTFGVETSCQIVSGIYRMFSPRTTRCRIHPRNRNDLCGEMLSPGHWLVWMETSSWAPKALAKHGQMSKRLVDIYLAKHIICALGHVTRANARLPSYALFFPRTFTRRNLAMRCKKQDCAIPHDTTNHDNNYHGKSVTVVWKNKKITIVRGPDRLLCCPCDEPLHRRYSRKIFLRLCGAQGSDHPPSECSDPKYLDFPFEQLPGLLIDEPDANHPLFEEPPERLEEDSPIYHGDEPGSSTSTGVELPSGRLSAAEAVDDTLHSAMEVYLEESATRGDSSGDELKESEDETEESCDKDGDVDMADGDDPVGEDEDMYEDVETEAEAAAILLSCDFIVDPTYRAIICRSCNQVIRYKNAYRHRTQFHSTHHKISSRAIGKRRLQSCLMQLRANRPQYPSPDSEGIPRVEHLAVEMLLGCGVPGCSYKRICRTIRSYMRSHGLEQHRALSPAQRQPVHVRGHCFIRIKSETLYVRIQKVDGPSESTSDSPLALILQHSTARGVGDPHKNLVISDKRELTEVLYHGEWAKILQEVSFEALMAHATMPRKDEPILLRLRDTVRRYYQAIPPILSQLGNLTRSQIVSHTLQYNNFQLFREPQNVQSLTQDADEMTRFLSFNLRCASGPIENYPIHLHPLTREKLESLSSELARPGSLNLCIETLLHEVIWSFLSSPVPEYLKDDNACPLTRYLIAVHLRSPRGQFSKPTFVPPTLSRLQWSFRATACRQVLNIRSQYGDESNRAYVECVQPYLIAGKSTLFHSLKQSHVFYTTLSKNEPAYPRFGWDLEYKVLSMDGHPILMKDFAESLSGCLDTLSMRINRLFCGCHYEDILEHISARLDPNNPKMWLQDDPLNSDYGASVITNPVNGFRAFGPDKEDLTMRLLNHLSNQKHLFTKKLQDDGTAELEAHKGNIMDWICELDECVKLLFYLVTATWGGGARGTEADLIQHSNTVNNRHVFVFNGMLTIITKYSKTQSIQGHGVRVARCPSFAVSRLLLLLVTTVYPAALNIYPFVYSQS
ncbi:hypothetical protein ARMGADRAFT_1107053, partial [Armillaria gallica]